MLLLEALLAVCSQVHFLWSGPTSAPADHKQNTDPTRSDQLMMTPKVEFSECRINILHAVKFIFNNVSVNVTQQKYEWLLGIET